MKRAVVTGSSGFIGQHLVNRLKQDGFEVFRITHNMLDHFGKLRESMLKINPEYIFHLASYGNMGNQQNDDEIILANIIRTWTLLTATRDIKYNLFVNFSTSSVYGYNAEVMGEWCKLRPITMYAATKAGAEYICRAFRKKHQKIIVSIRPFSVYGPGEADFRFIPTVIHNAVFKKPSQIVLGNHDWIYIDDFIDGVMTITNNYQDLTKRTFNIGTGEMHSNEDVVQEISKYIPVEYDVKPEYKKYDSKIWVSDSKRLEKLNWRCKTSFEEGIQKTVSHYIKLYGTRSK